MAVGVNFEQANRILGPPEGVEEKDCQNLPVQLVVSAEIGPCFISCWQLTPDEIEEIQKNGFKLYLWVMGGGHPMVCVSPQYAEGMRDLLGKVVEPEEESEDAKSDS